MKFFYYQIFFETLHSQHSCMNIKKNAIKKWGHRAFLRVSRLLSWVFFTGLALKIRITLQIESLVLEIHKILSWT